MWMLSPGAFSLSDLGSYRDKSMLMSTVIDPSTFESDRLCDARYRDQVITFLRGVQENTLILVDRDMVLFEQLKTMIQQQGPIKSTKVATLLTELIKPGSNRIVRTPARCMATVANSDSLALMKTVRDKSVADSVIIHSTRVPLACAIGLEKHSITSLDEYTGSDFEERRRKWFSGIPALDEVDPKIVGRMSSVV